MPFQRPLARANPAKPRDLKRVMPGAERYFSPRALRVAVQGGHMARTLPVQDATCTNCRARFQASPKRTFFNLRRFTCVSCKQTFLYPMPDRARKVYWGIVWTFGVLIAVLWLAARGIPPPGFSPLALPVVFLRPTHTRNKAAHAPAPALPPSP